MTKFYTYAKRQGKSILHRGYEDGFPFLEKADYKPYLFVPSKSPNSKFSTLSGQPVEKIEFENSWDKREWVKKYEDVSGFKFYGSLDETTTFIYDNYPGEVKFDPSLIRKAIIDIELDGLINGDDFIERSPTEIVSITLKVEHEVTCFGMKDFKAPEGVKYYKCADEAVLLDTFLTVWEGYRPDVISGWNIEGFDIPYLVNRISTILSYDHATRLSPFRNLYKKIIPDKFGRDKLTYDIIGVAVLDYQEVYKKFTVQIHGQLESYSLNYVSYFELGEEKIDYSEFGTLMELYRKDFQRFMEYNIHDCELVYKIDARRRFFELIFEIAYIAKCNFQDVLKTIPVWEALIHAYLMDRRIVVPSKRMGGFPSSLPGGFVKEPIPGLYKWVMSFDVASLYPHLIMQYNISPETLVERVPTPDVDSLVEGAKFDPGSLSVAASGWGYRRDKAGFLAVLMRQIFDQRAVYKKQMIEAEKLLEADKKNPELIRQVASLKAKQQAYKILANSGYGALGNQYFTFFMYELATSITVSGQLTIKWVAKHLNEFMNKVMGTQGTDYVIAIDTDSVYLNCGPLVEKFLAKADKTKIVNFLDAFADKKCQPVIDRAFDALAKKMNAFDPCLEMKREAIAESGLWTGKKRYCLNVMDNEGVRFASPKMKATGLEVKRSSVPEMCRAALTECLEIILTKTEDDLISYEEKFKEKFMGSSIYDIARPSGMNGLNKYHDPVIRFKPKCPPHVKGALVFNEWLTDNGLTERYPPIGDGEKVKFVALKLPNRLRSEFFSWSGKVPDELNLTSIIDWREQYNATFYTPLKRLAEVARWNLEKEHTLEDL